MNRCAEHGPFLSPCCPWCEAERDTPAKGKPLPYPWPEDLDQARAQMDNNQIYAEWFSAPHQIPVDWEIG